MKILTSITVLLVALAAFGQSYRNVMYERDTNISRNYVRFVNTNNQYYGYDYTVNPSNYTTTNVIDWALGKMYEVGYTTNMTLTFTNAQNWVNYTLKLTGTHTVTWPTNTVMPSHANSNNVYNISIFGDGNYYVFPYGVGTGGTGDVSTWATYVAITNVNLNTNRLYFYDGHYLRADGTNLYYGHP